MASALHIGYREAKGHAIIFACVGWLSVLSFGLLGTGDRSIFGPLKWSDFVHFYTLGQIARTGPPSLLYDADVNTSAKSSSFRRPQAVASFRFTVPRRPFSSRPSAFCPTSWPDGSGQRSQLRSISGLFGTRQGKLDRFFAMRFSSSRRRLPFRLCGSCRCMVRRPLCPFLRLQLDGSPWKPTGRLPPVSLSAYWP